MKNIDESKAKEIIIIMYLKQNYNISHHSDCVKNITKNHWGLLRRVKVIMDTAVHYFTFQIHA